MPAMLTFSSTFYEVSISSETKDFRNLEKWKKIQFQGVQIMKMDNFQ